MKLSQKDGFTIVELLIVIIVIAILAAIAFVAYSGMQNRALDSKVQSDVRTTANSLESYKALNNEKYPTDLAAGNIKVVTSGTYSYKTNGSFYCFSIIENSVSYRATSTVASPNSGTCADVSMSTLICPGGYIPVSGNTTFGTNEFCIMKYEAKNVGGVATSQPAGVPWTSIFVSNAITASTAACSGCHLITEAEWMTLAADILSVPANWSGGAVGNGYVYQGHINASPATPLAASADDTDGLYGMTGGLAGVNRNTQRTYTLSNGEIIWDIGGNMAEWTNATIAANMQPGLTTETQYGNKDWNNSSIVWNGLPVLSRPEAINSTVATYSSTKGIGQLISNYSDTLTRAYARGGQASGGSQNGLLRLDFQYKTTQNSGNIGFRVAK
jgi:prepilin-type N-terminal cleavage/methylation domain-containing protein